MKQRTNVIGLSMKALSSQQAQALTEQQIRAVTGGSSYIPYAALTSGSTPAGYGSPAPKATNSYTRGCSTISKCARG